MHMQYEVKCLYVVSYGANAKYEKMLMQKWGKRYTLSLFPPLYDL